MGNQRGTCKKRFNERGIGLVAVLIAAGLLVLMALIVSKLLSEHNANSMRVENTTDCNNIAKTVSEYLSKDDNSIFITSVGPTGIGSNPNNFPNPSVVNEDGIQRFNFISGGTPAYSGPATLTLAPISINPSRYDQSNFRSNIVASNPNAIFNNYLNLKNSFNRLYAIAYAQSRCCTDVHSCNPAPFFDSAGSANPPGLKFANLSTPFQVFLGVNPTQDKNPVCNSNYGITGLINPLVKDIELQYQVRVVMNPLDQQKAYECVSNRGVQFPRDTNPPLTILSVDNKSPGSTICDPSGPSGVGVKKATPAVCIGANTNTVDVTVRTVRDDSLTAGGSQACVSCLGRLGIYQCDSAINTTTYDAIAACMGNTPATQKCIGSDPGSFFLCRIGEKSWFYTAANERVWEPCSSAHVHDGSYGSGFQTNARVVIDYNNSPTGDGTRQQTYTEAKITLTNLDPQKAYVVDVRAVDTGGTIAGPSFCNYSGNCSLNPTSPNPYIPARYRAHFAVENGPPTTGNISSATNQLGLASTVATGTVGADYPGALNSFGGAGSGRYYQCESAQVFFDAAYSYAPHAFGNPPTYFLGNEIVAGSVQKIGVGGTLAAHPIADRVCSPYDGACTTRQISTANTGGAFPNGQYRGQVIVGNECFDGTAPSNYDWCRDTNSNFSTTTPGAVTMISPANGDSQLSGVTGSVAVPAAAGKLCGVSFVCPHLTNAGSPDAPGTTPYTYDNHLASSAQYNEQCTLAQLNWIPAVDSGCVTNPGGTQHCLAVFDPCGRQANSAPDGGPYGVYSTTLVAAPPATTHSCRPGSGNACDGGAYCKSDFQCALQSTWPNDSRLCDNDGDCPFATDCGTAPAAQRAQCTTTYRCRDGGHVGLPTSTCNNSGQACTTNEGTCNAANKCTGNVARSCVTNADCSAAPGTCQYNGARGTCDAPTNATCGPNAGGGPRCPDLYSCGPNTPPPVACSWVLRPGMNCNAPDACNCSYAPSFTSSGTMDMIYDCLDASGAACSVPGGCTTPNPSQMGIACTNSCNQSVDCGSSGSNPGGSGACQIFCGCGGCAGGTVICNWPGNPGCHVVGQNTAHHGCYGCP